MQPDLFEVHAEVEQTHWWFVARRRIVRALIQQLAEGRERPLVIDVGCGTGANVAGLADMCDCIGIDTSAGAIRLARKRFPEISFLHGTAPEELGDAARQADFFTIMDVLEHVPDDAATLRRIVDAARPGAHVIITVPADMSLWSEHDVQFGHYRRYTSEELAAIWSSLPVESLLLTHYNARLYPLIWLARRLARLTGRTWGSAGSDLGAVPGPVNKALLGVFSGEQRSIGKALQLKQSAPFRRGVSLLAVLRRLPNRHIPS